MSTILNGNTILNAGTSIEASFPATIAGLQLWLDASDASTITTATGVSQWNDKSGNRNNATQATGSAQPTVRTAAQNGLDTLRFTASSSQRMSLSNSISATSGYTIFAIIRRGGPGGTNVVETLGSSVTNNAYSLEHYSDSVLYSALNNYAVISTAQSSTAYNLASAYIYGSATPGAIRFNRVDITASNSTPAPTATSFNLVGYGDTAYCNGEIGEILFYNSVLSLANIQLIEAYLKAKWGTP